MVEHDDDAIRVEQLLDAELDEVAEHVHGEDVVHEREVDRGDDELARPHLVAPGGARKHLLRERQAHRYIAGLWRLRPPQT